MRIPGVRSKIPLCMDKKHRRPNGTNTAGTIPGVIGVYVTGVILQVTGSWALVFGVAAGVTLVGLIFYLLFSSGKKLFD